MTCTCRRLAAGAIDQGTTVAAVVDDWDGKARPQGSGYDIGADERAGVRGRRYRIGGRVVDASGNGRAGGDADAERGTVAHREQ